MKQIYLLIALAIFPIFLLANQEGKKDKTSLHNAVLNGNKDLVKTLILKGANVNAIDNEGLAPLHIALSLFEKVGTRRTREFFRRAGVVSILISNGADVNAKDNEGSTPLRKTVLNGNKDLVKTLILKGANVNAIDNEGLAPLHIALSLFEKVGTRRTREFFRRAGVVSILISNGADVNAKDNEGSTPLRKTVLNGNKDLVKTLILKGANVNAIDNEGLAPLHIALSLFEKVGTRRTREFFRRAGVVSILISNGADVNIVSESTTANFWTTCKSSFKSKSYN